MFKYRNEIIQLLTKWKTHIIILIAVVLHSDSHAYENNEPSEYMTTSNANNSQFNNNENIIKIKMIIIYPLLLKKIQLFM